MRSHKSWIRRLLLLSAAALALIGIFNLLVDPYDVYRLVKISGINANKKLATKHVRLVKPALLRRNHYPALVMGSSRAEIGISPSHPGWQAGFRPAFNFGLSGAEIDEIAARLENVLARQRVRQIVLGLDFFMFNKSSPQRKDFRPEDGWTLYGLHPRQWLQTLATVDALDASLETLRKQDRVRYPGYLPDGQMDTTYNARRISSIGLRQNFRQVERQYFQSTYLPPPSGVFLFVHPETGHSSFESFRQILEMARQQNVDLRLFISPSHARLLEVVDQLGLWTTFEDWKRGLVETLAEEAASRPGSPPFVLWDFSGFNSVTTEEVPPVGDRKADMKFYWEASHYKKETGDLILDRIFDVDRPGIEVPADFGVPLAPAGLEQHLAAIRARKAQYEAAHPQDLAEIARLREDAGPESPVH